MRKPVALISALVLVGTGLAAADEPQKPAQPKAKANAQTQAMPDMKEMMERWTEVATPGPQHKLLDSFIGTWKVTSKMWWAGPGTPPTVSEGTSTMTWIMGGRYVLEKMSSQIPWPAEDGTMKTMDFKGMSITGYDNFRKTYQSIWVDNFGTGMFSMTGAADPDGKLFRYYGAVDEPMLGVVGRMIRVVIRVIDADTHVFEMYDLLMGEDYKAMEMTYKRVK